jgi:hypothetical protein
MSNYEAKDNPRRSMRVTNYVNGKKVSKMANKMSLKGN